MASVETCVCGASLDGITDDADVLIHSRHIVRNLMEKNKMQNEKPSWQYGVAFNKIQSFFQRKSTCPLADCKNYVEAHTMIECVQHLKNYLNSIDLGMGKENEKN